MGSVAKSMALVPGWLDIVIDFTMVEEGIGNMKRRVVGNVEVAVMRSTRTMLISSHNMHRATVLTQRMQQRSLALGRKRNVYL